MVRVRVIAEGLGEPKGKVMDIPKQQAEEGLADGVIELIKGQVVKGVGFVEEEKNEFSLYDNPSHNGVTNTTPNKSITTAQCVEILKKDKPLIELIRKEADKTKRDNLKKKSAYVTFGGTFTTRAKENLICSSGYASFDLDILPNLEEIKQKLMEDKYIHLLFISPSGNGLKLVVKIPKVEDDAEYKKYWNSIAEYLNMPEQQDDKCKDISRACFLSVDKEPYYNPNSETYTDKTDVSLPQPAAVETTEKESRELTPDDERIIEEIKSKWVEGDRQNLTLALAGYLRKEKRFGFNHTLEIVKQICEEMGDKDVNERAGAVQETYKKDEKEILGITGLKELDIDLDGVGDFKARDFLTSKGINKSTGKEEFKVNVDKVAAHFTNKYDFRTINKGEKDRLYFFNGKFYEPTGRAFIKENFEELLNKYVRLNPLNEVMSKVERQNYISEEEFDKTDLSLIPLNNGVFNIEEKALQDHSPKNYFKTIIPIDYDATAKCPVFMKFINEALYPEDVQVMKQWFGFQLLREYLIKKAMVLLGARDTGKTVLLEVMINFIGEQNKTGLSLQKIGSTNDFVKISLKDKHSNIYDDLSSQDINDGGNFKVATGGGNISAEEKFGGFYQFRNYAKHMFASNKIPPVKDSDDMAYFSRWMVIRFDNQPENIDLFLKKKIAKENPGILNWALQGLYDLLEKGKFSYNKTPEEVKIIMEMSGDPLIQFGDEVLEKSEENVTKEEMYEIYSVWASEFDKPLLSKSQLGNQLNKKVKYLVAKAGKKVRYWDNVKIKDEWKQKITPKDEKQGKLDTLDTISKTYREILGSDNSDINDNSKIEDKIFEKVSKPSNISEEKEGISPQFTAEELKKAGYSQEEINELSKDDEALKNIKCEFPNAPVGTRKPFKNNEKEVTLENDKK